MDLGKLFCCAFVSLGLAAAQPGPGPRPPAPFPFLDLAGPLGLTQKQSDDIRQKFEAHAKSLEGKRSEARKAHTALMQAVGDPATKPEQLKALAAKASQAQLDELLEGHALLQESAALLSPEQREKLAKLRPEGPFPGPEGRGGHGHPGRPGHPGGMPPPPPPGMEMDEPPCGRQ